MPTVLVIAPPHARRDAWTAALTRAGAHVEVAPSLLAALSCLEQAELAAMVYEPVEALDHTVLGALSNTIDLPPVVLMAPCAVAVATRVPALERLAPDAPVDAVRAAVARAGALGRGASRLPFRICPAVIAQWTVRGSATRTAATQASIEGIEPGDPAEAFDGVTHPDGFVLDA